MSSPKSRYNLRSSVADMGSISTRTRSSGSVIITKELPARKRATRVKSEPSTPGVVVKVEPPERSSDVETTISQPSVVQVKVEPASSSSIFSTLKVESPPPPSSVSSSRSSSPIFLKAEPRASSPSLSSLPSLSPVPQVSSPCSSYHLSSSSPPPPSPPPPRRDDNAMDSWSISRSMSDAPSGSTARVWDMQHGQLVVRELPLVQEKPRYERERSVSPYRRPYYRKPYYKKPYYKKPYYKKPYYKEPYYKKPYYKKPYKPYWKRNDREGDGSGGSRWDCQCTGSSCSSCGAVTRYQGNHKPMNIHCDISINSPSTHRSSSAYIEELTDEGGSSSSHKKKSDAVALPSSHYSHSKPVVVPVPVPVMVPQSAHHYDQPQHVSYSYMGYNVSCSTRFY